MVCSTHTLGKRTITLHRGLIFLFSAIKGIIFSALKLLSTALTFYAFFHISLTPFHPSLTLSLFLFNNPSSSTHHHKNHHTNFTNTISPPYFASHHHPNACHRHWRVSHHRHQLTSKKDFLTTLHCTTTSSVIFFIKKP